MRGAEGSQMRTLLIDNYDSYTFNLFHLLGEVNGGDEPIVVRNDELSWDELVGLAPDNIVISPGPGRPEHPRDAGISLEVLRRAEVPVLGVCLGHQVIVEMYGGRVDRAGAIVHGKPDSVSHDGSSLYRDIPSPFEAGRYHSLAAVGDIPSELVVTSRTPDGEVMGVRHVDREVHGVQFHPESVLTPLGPTLIRNFLALGVNGR
jgi:anthranilate synthase/aminodeoxychorismate synthase-like glutamine amidotransferase